MACQKAYHLKVEKGKIVTLIGPNGSGKSTTAKIALGIYKNIEGNVEKYTNNSWICTSKNFNRLDITFKSK